MAFEIERKYLVVGDGWREGARRSRIRQGYLVANPRCAVRIRTRDDEAFLTIKGERTGVTRSEYEYAIPASDAAEMLEMCATGFLIEKWRYETTYDNRLWVVDIFSGENFGLVVTEVELENENTVLKIPSWVGREVTHEERYLNAKLFMRPFSQWTEAERF